MAPVNTTFIAPISKEEYNMSFLCWTLFNTIGTITALTIAIRVKSTENLTIKDINITFKIPMVTEVLLSLSTDNKIEIQAKGMT